MKTQTRFKNSLQASHVARHIAQDFNRGTAMEQHIESVLNHIREELGVKALTKLDNDTVRAFVDYLHDRLEAGELSRSTVSNYISALNDIVKYANEQLNKDIQTVSAREVNLSRGGIQYQDRTVSQEVHTQFREYLESQNDIQAQSLSHSVELQRQFGLRLRESLSIKQSTIQQALRTGELQLSRNDGTKNSQPRTVPIVSESQRQALQSALSFMKENNLKSLIPTNTRKEQYQFAQNIRTEFNRQSGSKMDYHGERHYFAQNMLQQGYSRQQVSKMLGHHREEILKYYAGG